VPPRQTPAAPAAGIATLEADGVLPTAAGGGGWRRVAAAASRKTY